MAPPTPPDSIPRLARTSDEALAIRLLHRHHFVLNLVPALSLGFIIVALTQLGHRDNCPTYIARRVHPSPRRALFAITVATIATINQATPIYFGWAPSRWSSIARNSLRKRRSILHHLRGGNSDRNAIEQITTEEEGRHDGGIQEEEASEGEEANATPDIEKFIRDGGPSKKPIDDTRALTTDEIDNFNNLTPQQQRAYVMEQATNLPVPDIDDYPAETRDMMFDAVRRIWCEALGRPSEQRHIFKEDDDFMKVGGDVLGITKTAFSLGTSYEEAYAKRLLKDHVQIYARTETLNDAEARRRERITRTFKEQKYSSSQSSPKLSPLNWTSSLIPLRRGFVDTLSRLGILSKSNGTKKAEEGDDTPGHEHRFDGYGRTVDEDDGEVFDDPARILRERVRENLEKKFGEGADEQTNLKQYPKKMRALPQGKIDEEVEDDSYDGLFDPGDAWVRTEKEERLKNEREGRYSMDPMDAPFPRTIATLPKRGISFGEISGLAIRMQEGNRSFSLFTCDKDTHQLKRVEVSVSNVENFDTKEISGDASYCIQSVLASGNGRASLADGKAFEAMMMEPSRCAVDRQGRVLVCDTMNHRIRLVHRSGMVTTITGKGMAGDRDGTASMAQFDHPVGIAIDHLDRVYIADSRNCKIRRISADYACVETFAGTGEFGERDGPRLDAMFKNPHGIAVARAIADGDISNEDVTVFVSSPILRHNIRRICPNGMVTHYAGSGERGYKDGYHSHASFDTPLDLCVDLYGNVLVADTGNHAIRAVTPERYVFTVSGGPRAQYGTRRLKDGLAARATFNSPTGICLDHQHNVVFVADAGNKAIRVLKRDWKLQSQLEEALNGQSQAGLMDPGTLSYASASREGTPVLDALNDWADLDEGLQSSWREATEGYLSWKSRFTGESEKWAGYDQFQNITMNVYLGNVAGAMDLTKLQHAGITHILNVLGFWEAPTADERGIDGGGEDLQFRDRVHPLFDGDYREIVIGGLRDVLEALLDKALPWIENAVNHGGKVLLICEKGESLSPAIAIGYLMSKSHVTFERARDRVLNQREIVHIPKWLASELFQFENTINVYHDGLTNYDDPEEMEKQRQQNELEFHQGEFNTDEYDEEMMRAKEASEIRWHI